MKIVKNKSLVEKIKSLEKDHDLKLANWAIISQSKSYVECKILKDKNLELTTSLQNFTNNKNRIYIMLENQHCFHNKKELGFNKRRKNKKRSKGSYRKKALWFH